MSSQAFPETPLEFALFDWIEWSEAPAYEILEHRLKLVEAADAAGFYGWHIAEHQGTPLSIDVSPALVLAAAAQRTKRIRLGALVFSLPWYSPYRFYNEVCILDHLSRGRLELGVGRGVSPIESTYYGIQSIEESRERYRETLEIVFAACRSKVLNYEGTYHTYRDVEIFNRPYQLPYPPLWFPSSNRDTVRFVAQHGYNTCLNYGTPAEVREVYDEYREVWLEHKEDPGRHNGHVPAPKLGTHHHIVVADTDTEALELARSAHEVWADHIGWLNRKHGQPPQLRDLEFDSRYAKG